MRLNLMNKRLQDRQDEGFTLVELLVVMAILTMLMGAVTTTMITTQRSVADDSSRLGNAGQAIVASEAITKTLRTAILPRQLEGTCTTCDVAAFISGDARRMSFYANLNNNGVVDGSGYTTDGPVKVSYAVSTAGDLTETVQRPDAHLPNDFNFTWCNPALSSCAKSVRTVATGVSTTATLFTYYDKAGTTLATPSGVLEHHARGGRQRRPADQDPGARPGPRHRDRYARHPAERRLRSAVVHELGRGDLDDKPQGLRPSPHARCQRRGHRDDPRPRHHRGHDDPARRPARLCDADAAPGAPRPGHQRSPRRCAGRDRRLRVQAQPEGQLRPDRRLHRTWPSGARQWAATPAAGRPAPHRAGSR